MKWTRLLAMFFNLYSMSAVAGYECMIHLSSSDDIQKIIASKTISVESGEMISGDFGTLLVESSSKNKKISLAISAVMSGWKGSEDASLIVHRTSEKNEDTRSVAVSDSMTFKDTDSITSWFEEYKIDINCQVK